MSNNARRLACWLVILFSLSIIQSLPAQQTVEVATGSYESDFARAAESLTSSGDKIALSSIPGMSDLALFNNINLSETSFSRGQFAEGDEKGQPWLCVTGKATLKFARLGEVSGRVIALSRLFHQEGIKTALIIVGEPDKIRTKITGLNSEAMRQIKFAGAAFSYANEAHEWAASELPASIKNDLKPFIAEGNLPLTLAKGESACFIARLNDNSILGKPLEMLGTTPPALLFNVIFAQTHDESTRLRARLLNSFKPSLKLPVGLTLNLPSGLDIFTLSPAQLMSAIKFSADYDLSSLGIDLSGSIPMDLSFPLAKSDINKGFALTAHIPDNWHNPFGLPFSIYAIKLSGTIAGELPALGIGGIVDFGSLKLNVGTLLSAGTVVGLKAASDLVRFADIAQFARLRLPEEPYSHLAVKNFEFTAAKITDPGLNLSKGVTVSGDLTFKDSLTLGSLRLNIFEPSGITCQGWCRPIDLGTLSVTGAGPDKQAGNDDDGPAIDLIYRPDAEPPLDAQQKFYLSGEIRIPVAATTLETLLDVSADRVGISMHGKLAGMFSAEIQATGSHEILTSKQKGADLEFSGRLAADFINPLRGRLVDTVGGDQAVRTVLAMMGGLALNINSVEISGRFSDLASGKVSNLMVKASVFGRDFAVNSANVAFSDLMNIRNRVSQVIVEIASGLHKSLPVSQPEKNTANH
jgi:hypothetical protein